MRKRFMHSSNAADPGPNVNVNESQVAALAYSLWTERGCPEGTPQLDWFRAEELLRSGKVNFAQDRNAVAA